MDAITEALDAMATGGAADIRNSTRSAQIGSGMRSDKRRTWRYQAGLVIDHVTGRSERIERVMAGGFDRLW